MENGWSDGRNSDEGRGEVVELRCWWILLILSLKNRRRELQVSEEYRSAGRVRGVE